MIDYGAIRVRAAALVAVLALLAGPAALEAQERPRAEAGTRVADEEQGAAAADSGAAAAEEAPRRVVNRRAPALLAAPTGARNREIRDRAAAAGGKRVVVSTQHRWLWYLDGDRVLLSAPAAVGKATPFRYGERTYRFQTPIGVRRVLMKEPNPLWRPPDWHYKQKAVNQRLELVRMQRDTLYELSDGTMLEIRGEHVGRINHYGNWWPITPGVEIVFDGKIYMPPLDTHQRRVPEALGPYKIDLGDAYLIHGTNPYTEDTVGQAVSHGCVRLDNADLEKLYPLVARGTPVYIY
jgi:hypothetical protein